jgi:M6 family metalloprotease-like protein
MPQVASGNVGLGFPPAAYRMSTIGTVRAKVLFVDFADAPANQTPQQVFSIISPGAPDFYKAVSYGRMNFQLEPHLVWLRMSKPSADYSMARGMTFQAQRAYIQEAINLADPAVDFAGVQSLYVITNPQATAVPGAAAFSTQNSRDAFLVDGTTIYRSLTTGASLLNAGYRNINHEVGHTMGLVDLYLNTPVPPLTTHSMVGSFSLMGYNFPDGKAPEYLAYERWNLGWLDDNQIICQTANDQTTTLTPIETAGGIKAIVIPTGKSTAVIVESRRALGYDNKIAKPGALVYTLDTSIKSIEGPVKVVPVIDGDAMRDQSPRAVGESITVGTVTIKVTAADANGDTVQVTVGK